MNDDDDEINGSSAFYSGYDINQDGDYVYTVRTVNRVLKDKLKFCVILGEPLYAEIKEYEFYNCRAPANRYSAKKKVKIYNDEFDEEEIGVQIQFISRRRYQW